MNNSKKRGDENCNNVYSKVTTFPSIKRLNLKSFLQYQTKAISKYIFNPISKVDEVTLICICVATFFAINGYYLQVKRDMVAIKQELDTVQQVKEEIEELREYVDRLEEHSQRRKLRLLEQVGNTSNP